MSEKFKVGTEVIVSSEYSEWPSEMIGTIIELEGDRKPLVQFKEHTKQCGHGVKMQCWYIHGDYLTPTAAPKVKKAPKGPQAYKGNGKHAWELVTGDVSRLRVPGGWIYDSGEALAFVPVPQAVGYAV
jgi:hypothetical protein